MSSDAGVLVLRETERRHRITERMAACIVDQRAPEQITHTLADIIRFRLLMIAAGTRTATTPTAFASTPSSRWRTIFRPRIAIGVRGRLSIVPKTAGRSSISFHRTKEIATVAAAIVATMAVRDAKSP